MERTSEKFDSQLARFNEDQMPFGTKPRFCTRLKSLVFAEGKYKLEDEEAAYQELKLIHEAGLRTAGIRQ